MSEEWKLWDWKQCLIQCLIKHCLALCRGHSLLSVGLHRTMKEENWKKPPTKTQTNRKYKHISEAVRFSWCEMFLLCCVFFTLHIRSTFSSYSLSAFNMALSTFQPSGCLIHSLDNLSESGRFVKAFLNWISRLSLNVSCFVSFFLDPFLMEVSDPMEYLHLLFGPPLNSTDNVTNFIFSFCKWKKVLILNKWCIFFFCYTLQDVLHRLVPADKQST